MAFSVLYIWESTFEALTQAGFRCFATICMDVVFQTGPKNIQPRLFDTQLEELLPALDIQGPVDLSDTRDGRPIVASTRTIIRARFAA